jgi:hypothetical protein
MWWRSAVNLSFLLSFATFRMRSRPVTHLPGPAPGACVAVPHFPRPRPLAPPTPRPVARSCSQVSQLLWPGLTSQPRASPASAPHLPGADRQLAPLAKDEISRFPNKKRPCRLGSLTAPGRPTARVSAAGRVAFRVGNPVGTRDKGLTRLNGQPPLIRFAAQAPADASPCPAWNTAHGAGPARLAMSSR